MTPFSLAMQQHRYALLFAAGDLRRFLPKKITLHTPTKVRYNVRKNIKVPLCKDYELTKISVPCLSLELE